MNFKYQGKMIDEHNNIIAQFIISDYYSKKQLEELSKEKNYQAEIKEVKSKRSLNQNSFFWKILQDIEKASKQDVMKIYIDLLKITKAKYTYIKVASQEIEKDLKKVFRAIEFIKTDEVRGHDEFIYRCYIGSSKFNTKEMTELIERALDYASEYNLYYTEVPQY